MFAQTDGCFPSNFLAFPLQENQLEAGLFLFCLFSPLLLADKNLLHHDTVLYSEETRAGCQRQMDRLSTSHQLEVN